VGTTRPLASVTSTRGSPSSTRRTASDASMWLLPLSPWVLCYHGGQRGPHAQDRGTANVRAFRSTTQPNRPFTDHWSPSHAAPGQRSRRSRAPPRPQADREGDDCSPSSTRTRLSTRLELDLKCQTTRAYLRVSAQALDHLRGRRLMTTLRSLYPLRTQRASTRDSGLDQGVSPRSTLARDA
jgi:hypothetical protein